MTRAQTEKQAKAAKSGRANGALADPDQQLRLIEALLFASAEPLDEAALADRLPEGADVKALLAELTETYANRGVRLAKVGKGWAFRTAADLSPYLRSETTVSRTLSPAMTETLAIIAYHQPVTRAEIEEIRGKSLSRGTLDLLLQAGWVKPRGHRRSPGRPMTWGTSDAFLDHFGLESLDALPGIEDLKAAGLLDSRPAITAYGAIAKPGGDQLPEPAEEESEAAANLLEPLAADEDGEGAKPGR